MSPTQTGSKDKLKCPACQKTLVTVVSHDAEVEACQGCEGAWTDFMDEKVFLQKLPVALTIDDIRRLRRVYEPLGKVEPVKYRKCPICQDLMHRLNWGGSSGVIVDRCYAHGTWYDAGEAEKIREYVALGGIEYEKLRHHEKATDDVKNKLHKEVSRLDARIQASRHLISHIWTAISYTK